MAQGSRGQSTLAARYADALLDLGEERGALDTIADDLRNLRQMIAGSSDLTRLVRSPVLDRDDQARGLDAVASQAGFHQVTRNFLGLLCQKRRLFVLDAITQSYLDKLAAKRGQVTAEVIAAQPLSDSQIQAVTDQLKAAAGAQVDVQTRVDESLLGGLTVRLGSQLIDHSLRSKLARLQSAMKGVG